jgi:hypothetical protein
MPNFMHLQALAGSAGVAGRNTQSSNSQVRAQHSVGFSSCTETGGIYMLLFMQAMATPSTQDFNTYGAGR